MLKQIAESGLIVQRACGRLITVVATAAVSVHSPLFVLLGMAWLSSQQVAVAPIVDDAGCIPAEW